MTMTSSGDETETRCSTRDSNFSPHHRQPPLHPSFPFTLPTFSATATSTPTDDTPQPTPMSDVKRDARNPLLFECAWEVANKVGGIYTVIKTKVPVTVSEYGDRYTLIGPLSYKTAPMEVEAQEPTDPHLAATLDGMRAAGVKMLYGRWLIEGAPNVLLFDTGSQYSRLDEWKADLWNLAGIPTPPNDHETNETIVFGYIVAWFLGEVRCLLHAFGFISLGLLVELVLHSRFALSWLVILASCLCANMTRVRLPYLPSPRDDSSAFPLTFTNYRVTGSATLGHSTTPTSKRASRPHNFASPRPRMLMTIWLIAPSSPSAPVIRNKSRPITSFCSLMEPPGHSKAPREHQASSRALS